MWWWSWCKEALSVGLSISKSCPYRHALRSIRIVHRHTVWSRLYPIRARLFRYSQYRSCHHKMHGVVKHGLLVLIISQWLHLSVKSAPGLHGSIWRTEFMSPKICTLLSGNSAPIKLGLEWNPAICALMSLLMHVEVIGDDHLCVNLIGTVLFEIDVIAKVMLETADTILFCVGQLSTGKQAIIYIMARFSLQHLLIFQSLIPWRSTQPLLVDIVSEGQGMRYRGVALCPCCNLYKYETPHTTSCHGHVFFFGRSSIGWMCQVMQI